MLAAKPALLPAPRSGLLAQTTMFLDIDGTLLDLTDRPEDVVADGDLRALLANLAVKLDGRLAVVSGRSLDQIDTILGPIAQAIPVTGSHGLEYRWNGIWARPERPASLDEVAQHFSVLARQFPGMLVEEKTYGVALHWRMVAPESAHPARNQARDQARSQAQALAAQLATIHGLVVQHGSDVAELRLAGGDKGQAVRRLMARRGMGGTTPLFFGDDLTDEAGFVAARDLGGRGVLVGARALAGAETAAIYTLPSPAAVRDWLRKAAA